MFTNLETRQTVAIIRESKIRGQSHEDAPGHQPPIKRLVGMAFQAPPVLIVDEPCCEHLRTRHDPKELAVVRQLGDVVWSRGRGGAAAVQQSRWGVPAKARISPVRVIPSVAVVIDFHSTPCPSSAAVTT